MWVPFWSALAGGLLVLLGQLINHTLSERSKNKSRKYAEETRIAELALEFVNWLETDKQRVFDAQGGPMQGVEHGHPVYKLAAAIRKTRPDLRDDASSLLGLFRDYTDTTRILMPRAQPAEKPGLSDRITGSANEMTGLLSKIVEMVCE